MPVTAAGVQVVPGPNRWGTPMIAPAGGSGHRAPQNNARAAPESGAITSHRRLVSSGSLTDSSWQQRCAGLASLLAPVQTSIRLAAQCFMQDSCPICIRSASAGSRTCMQISFRSASAETRADADVRVESQHKPLQYCRSCSKHLGPAASWLSAGSRQVLLSPTVMR